MTGQGENQPVEGGDSLDDLAAALEPQEQEQQEAAPEESESEESDEPEVEPEGDDEQQEEAEEPSFTITVDGKELTLTKSELIERAQKGEDYSRKTMALAEERKALTPLKEQAETFKKQAEEANTEAIARLEAYSKVIESSLGSEPPIDLAARDPGAYLAQQKLHESKKGQLQQALAEVRALRDQQHRERQAELDRKAQHTLKVLADTLPGWNDTKLKDLGDYLIERGITPDRHADTFVEAGIWEMANKARAYDAIQAAKAQAKPKAPITQVAKPGAANPAGKTAERMKREAAFNKNPSVDALAEFLR